MAESNPMRWVVLAFIAAGLFAVGLVTVVDRQVDAAKTKAAAEAQEMDQRVARADQQVTSGLDRAATVAAPFIAEIAAGRFADAYARLAVPYRAAVSLAAFTETCRRSPILMGGRQVTLRRLRTQSGGGGATLEADGLLDSTAGAVPISFVFLQEPAGPRILVVSLAGVPLLQGVTPGALTVRAEIHRRPQDLCPPGGRSNVDCVKGAKRRRRMGLPARLPVTDEEDVMANYLYVFRGGDMARMSPQQMEENMKKWGAWMGQLSQTGNFKGGDPLEQGGRVVAGKKKAVTDGPFGETKDLVGGYLLVTASSLDAATELARGCPIFESETGSVEVREVREMRM